MTAEFDFKALQEAISRIPELEGENEVLKESIAEVRAMFAYEDQGWLALGVLGYQGDCHEGLDLEEVQQIAEKLEPKVAGSSLPKRASDLHSGFVFGRGYYIEGTQKPNRGRDSKQRSFFIKRSNQEAVFSDTATEELQRARFITGNVLVACNTKTQTVNRIPFKEIVGIKVDPDFPENIIAYQRKWDTKDGTTNSIRRKWYYTARYEGVRRKSFTTNGDTIPVAANETIVDLRANRQVGHVLGLPDGLAGILWSETYGRIIRYGETVQESLAKILFRVTNKTAKGTATTGVKIANFGGHGGTASMAEGQELSAVSTAGRGYDFSTARPVAAMAAAAWNVSNMDLLNDSSAAGSSYGSANALVGGNRNAMFLMQREWAEFFKTIFEVMGLGRPRVTFEPFETPDPYRSAQALKLLSDALTDEEYRTASLDILDIVADGSEIPPLLKMRSAVQDTAAQQASPDQGKSNGTNSGGKGANDQRTDTVSAESLRQEMAVELMMDKLSMLIERLEGNSSNI